MTINKVLLVDDSQTDLLHLEQIVGATGCQVISANSGAEAVKKVKAEKPDLVFMDIVMDELNGYEACRAIKEDPDTENIPIIFVSSKHQKADHIWAKRQGGDALVGKPCTKDEIIEHIQRLS